VPDLAGAMPQRQIIRASTWSSPRVAHQNAQASAYREERVGTLQLARLSAAAGVACFVFLSSVKAMGAAADDS
jgi:nucleoside-diphosphate-sugar epimerase